MMTYNELESIASDPRKLQEHFQSFYRKVQKTTQLENSLIIDVNQNHRYKRIFLNNMRYGRNFLILY